MTTVFKFGSILLYASLVGTSMKWDSLTTVPVRYVHFFELCLGAWILKNNVLVLVLSCTPYDVKVHRQVLPLSESMLEVYTLMVGLSVGIR
jgi:hypothetical protein